MDIKNKMKFVFGHFDFKFNVFAVFLLLISVLFIPNILNLLPESMGYENSLLENIQMVILALCGFFALKTKDKENKKFYIFAFLVVILLMLRETNSLRTVFFPIKGEINEFYRWDELPYGYLANPLTGLYMALCGLYFIKNKLWKNLINILTAYKLPFFNLVFLIVGMIIAYYVDKATDFFVLEEVAELLFYFALFSIIYLYSRQKQARVEDKNN